MLVAIVPLKSLLHCTAILMFLLSNFIQIQGGIIAASILQILLGLTGIVGLVCQYIRPITFAITISSIGLSLVKPAGDFSSK